MEETKHYTLEEAHLHFAKTLNGEVWGLLEKPTLSQTESEQMVYAAHASCYHWLSAGSGVNHQRGEWLIAHIYTHLGIQEPALRHASRCMELTREFAELMQDFDWAYAYEGLARANAMAGNQEGALKYIHQAEDAGHSIGDEEDKKIFFDDFNGGNWYGLK